MPVVTPNQLCVPQGSSKTFCLSVKDEDGAPVDLTSAKVWFCVKEHPACSDSDIYKSSLNGPAEVLITDPPNGVAQIYLTPSDTLDLAPKRYTYEVWVELISGKRYQVVPPSVFEITRTLCPVP